MGRGKDEEGPGGTMVGVWCPAEPGLRRSWSLLGMVCELAFTPPDWAAFPSITSRYRFGELLSSSLCAAASSLVSERLDGSSLLFSFVAYILRITDVGVNDGDNMLVTVLPGECLPAG